MITSFLLNSLLWLTSWLKTSLSAREALGSIPGLVKSYTVENVSNMARHRCDVSVLPRR